MLIYIKAKIEKGILRCLKSNSQNLKSFRKKTFVVYNAKAKHIANEYAKTFKELCDQPAKVTFQAINEMMRMQNNSELAQLRKIKQVYLHLQKQIGFLLFASAFVSFSK